jgi:hypothetical protein
MARRKPLDVELINKLMEHGKHSFQGRAGEMTCPIDNVFSEDPMRPTRDTMRVPRGRIDCHSRRAISVLPSSPHTKLAHPSASPAPLTRLRGADAGQGAWGNLSMVLEGSCIDSRPGVLPRRLERSPCGCSGTSDIVSDGVDNLSGSRAPRPVPARSEVP